MFEAPILFRRLIAVVALLAVAACGARDPLDEPMVDLGEFRLGHNIVVAQNAQRGAFSREVEDELLASIMREEIDRRFGRYDGSQMYHIAVNIDGYVLAVAGVPLVASPRSVLIISANVWDDELGRRLNEEPRQLTIVERASGETFIGSGLTQTAEDQMRTLARSAARSIQNWMLQNPEWFALKPAAAGDGAEPGAGGA